MWIIKGSRDPRQRAPQVRTSGDGEALGMAEEGQHGCGREVEKLSV